MVDNSIKVRRRSYPTVTLLLFAVNVPLAVLVALLLVTDYRREMRRATDARRITLSDEASVIGNALLRLSEPDDATAITTFLESSCAETAGPDTPGHWIDVRWNGKRLHTHTGPDSEQNTEPEIGRVQDAIVGRFSAGDLQVAVTERAAEIRRSARGETFMHLSGILGLASLAAIIVDVVLVRLIANPTKRLTETVEQLQSNAIPDGTTFVSQSRTERPKFSDCPDGGIAAPCGSRPKRRDANALVTFKITCCRNVFVFPA